MTTLQQFDRCQYGEEEIILPFFDGLRGGFVVDCGAADGILFSHSRFLIRDWGWTGILVEPESESFAALHALYIDNLQVDAVSAAISERGGIADMWPRELGGSTLSESWRDRFVEGSFGLPVTVETTPLAELLNRYGSPATIDFLTVDCEGMDFEVLRSMDWDAYNVRLLCVESGWKGEPAVPMGEYLKERGFVYHANTAGNTFWRNTK